ncbi:MAG: DUF4349 domain-containing protein [Clostridiales bacterium]|nr:DUF4349 domain-containing protein [Clostridiales bacterium]
MKRMKWLAAAMALLLALGLVSCSSVSNISADSSSAESLKVSSAAAEAVAEDADYGYDGYDSVETEEADTAESTESLADSYDSSQVKLIYTAWVDVEVLDFDAAVSGLEALVDELGGYCESSYLSNYSSDRYASYTVRVPQEQYRAFLDAWSESDNCHLLSREEDVDDVGTEYFDLETRLNTLNTKMERLQALLAQAEEMADIIALESEISDTEYEIEYYTSQLNRYDSLINYSTVYLTIDEVIELTEDEEQSLGARLLQNLRWGAESFVDGLEEFAVWLARNLIQLIITVIVAAAFVVVIVRMCRKRKRAGKRTENNQTSPTKPEPAESETGKKK